MFADNAITSFMHHSQIIIDDGKSVAKNARDEHTLKVVNKYPSLSEFFRWFPQNKYSKPKQAKFYQEAYEIISEADFMVFAEYFEGADFDVKAVLWKAYQEASRTMALYLRPILLAIEFDHYKPKNKLLPLMSIIRNHYASGKGPSKLTLPDDSISVISSKVIPYLKSEKTDENINPYRLEFYLYNKMLHNLNRGRLFCNDSISFRDIECDLISGEALKKAEKKAKQYGYNKIPIICEGHLNSLLRELNDTWDRVLGNIENNKNEGVDITYSEDGTPNWKLNYDAREKLDHAFFNKIPKIDIASLFKFVDAETGAFNGFEHIKDRYVKRTKPISTAITACVLSEAFGFSTEKMAEISDMDHNLLKSTKEDFIRHETLCNANDIIANYINELPIFKEWSLLDEKLLADIDGQKAETKNNTIQTRYSKKYLGKGKGISVISLVANFVAVNVKNIGLNEYEGHHLYNMVSGNQSDIQIDSVTGDNHSLNQLNFIVLDSMNVEFLPSIKKIRDEADKLYSVKGVKNYDGLIQPVGKIKINRIRSQSEEIIRVLLSLISQESSQTTIIKKLNSHSRYAALKTAFVEYNKIYKTIHVLNMIDNMPLRKAIRTARNRTEAYHQLQKLIRNMYHGIYKSKRIVNHQVSTQSVRLVSNMVVAYDAIILNQVYEKLVARNCSETIIETFLRISPMSWRHISFTGKYTFNGNDLKINLAKIIDILEKELG